MTKTLWDDICTCGHKRDFHFQAKYANHCLIQGCTCHWFTLDVDREPDDSDGDLVPSMDGDDENGL